MAPPEEDSISEGPAPGGSASLFKVIGEHGTWQALDADGKRSWRLVSKEVRVDRRNDHFKRMIISYRRDEMRGAATMAVPWQKFRWP